MEKRLFVQVYETISESDVCKNIVLCYLIAKGQPWIYIAANI